MNKLHAKSPCCQGKTIKFGDRRRQCVSCKKTWRIRKKKRGRKLMRINTNLFKKYLNQETPSLYALARISKRQSDDKLQRRVKQGLKLFLKKTNWPKLPKDEKLVALADAMIATINKKVFAFYFILLKTPNSNKAVITKPYIKEGTESWLGWQEAFDYLPKGVLASIRALVSDGHIGLLSATKQHQWIIQRCNFHLIAKIQGRRSRWARSRHQALGERLYQLVNKVLTEPKRMNILDDLNELNTIGINASGQLKKYLSGFINNYREYRTYLRYPKLNLPRTNNSVETLIGGIRRLCSKARGFRTIESMTLWAHAYLKNKKMATCNGYSPTKLIR